MAISMKNTKKEIIDAYRSLERENKSLQAEITKLKTENRTLQSNLEKGLTVQKVVQTKAQPIKTTPAVSFNGGGYQSVESVVTAFENIKGNVGIAISGLSDNLTKEAANLAVLQEESNEIESQLLELHQIEEAEESTLSDIIREYIEKSESFEKIITQTEKEQLEAEEEAKKAYEEAEDLHNSTLSERKKEWQTSLDRENEAYHYQRNLERQQIKDEAAQLAKVRAEELATLKEEQEKEWALREKLLSEKEQSYEEATQKAEELPKKLDNETKRVYEKTKAVIQRENKSKSDLLAKENEGKKRIAERQITALSGKIAHQDAQIKSLNAQLTSALKEAKELAIKAIDGASGAKSLAALREVAFEQSKQNGKK
ncbi:hypothetical protein [Bernardetia sp.]|uniref:hypothetical protein n=1 Tax=Bernardetia sp. TaxID=1937974 RepID=UPI0025C6D5A6|nr:hypothetical protein [Bernardetia sp.]